jgi:tetratricopeptide (TPR) repeat protein
MNAKIIRYGIMAVAVLGVGAFAFASQNNAGDGTFEMPRFPNPFAGNALRECDEAAAHPLDMNRRVAGVPDDQFVPAVAIEECEAAVEANPDEPRAVFQLGRAYWLAGRHAEAVALFAQIADTHAGAQKFLGDAYLEGRGLPEGQRQDLEIALQYYTDARTGGFAMPEEDIVALQERIERQRYDASIFRCPSCMTVLYRGNFDSISRADQPFFVRYMRGMIGFLNSDQAMDHAPQCAPLLNYTGNLNTNFADTLGFIDVIGRTSEGGVGGMFLGALAMNQAQDYGYRDAVILMNRYQCEGPAERIVHNLMEGGPVFLDRYVEQAQARSGQ